MTWEQKQLEAAISSARKKFGAVGWNMLGEEIRHALIKSEVLSIIAANDSFEDTPQGRLADLACRIGTDKC